MILLEKLKKVFIKRFKRNPVEEVYFESPAFLRRWHEFLMKSKWVRAAILVVILAGLACGAYFLTYKMEEPPHLSEFLPQDSTIAYVEIDREKYADLVAHSVSMQNPNWPWWAETVQLDSQIQITWQAQTAEQTTQSEPISNNFSSEVTGLGDRMGIAWIYNDEGAVTGQPGDNGGSFIEEWRFYEVEDKTAALKTLGLGQQEESMPYRFIGDYLVTGGGTLLLDEIKAVFNGEEPSLKKDENFMKLRPSLPYHSAVFFYAKPAELETWLKWGWNLDVEALGVTFPKAALGLQAFSHSFSLFPAMGAVIDPDGTSTRIQTYWVGDKTLIEDGTESFFHNNEKYKEKLLDYFPETTTQLFGGQNVAGGSGPGFVHQLAYVLDAADGVSGSALEQWMDEKITLWFGQTRSASGVSDSRIYSPAFSPSDATDFLTLFSRESALGLFQPGPVCTLNSETDIEQVCTESTPAYILALEIDNDEQGVRGLVNTLFEKLISRGYLEINAETSTLSVSTLTAHEAEEGDIPYTQIFKENGSLLFAFVVYDDILFIATSNEALRAVINTATGNQPSYTDTRAYLDVEKIISAGDQVLVTQTANSQIMSSFNGFDDGFGTVHLVTPIIFQAEDEIEADTNIEIDTPIEDSSTNTELI